MSAQKETQRLTEQAEQTVGTWKSMARLRAYLDQLVERGAPVPTRWHKGEHQISMTYMAVLVGYSPKQINSHLRTELREGFRDYAQRHPGPCPLSADHGADRRTAVDPIDRLHRAPTAHAAPERRLLHRPGVPDRHAAR
ncbi:hypothetical protein M8I34_17075 [Streptomyces sp. MCA2]|uniref:hypothetical protein n=1 Tax=Streptomyces sp. MCA2 TaxID=2944805 RepID=UPI002021E3B3|nr:hypothetical protein [Streptomyces sp. MCA2]MCL7493118.1 hypothetical protein [Streptomyces sp. MCA2]